MESRNNNLKNNNSKENNSIFNNPINYTAIPLHIWKWFHSSKDDIMYKNPNYKNIDENSPGIAIYCLHGLADGNGAFKDFAERILPYLPDNIESIHLVSFSECDKYTEMSGYAAVLENKIKNNGHKKVILVGHSRGALIASSFAESLDKYTPEIIVEYIFTLAAPFSGSPYAKDFFSSLSTTVDQMRIDSNFLTELQKKVNESNVPYFHFYAGKDSIVDVYSSISEQHKESTIYLDKHGHLSILTSWELIKLTLSKLFKKYGLEFENVESLTPQQYFLNMLAEIVYIQLSLDSRKHLFSSNVKINALYKLKEELKNLDKNYKENITIGEYIENCLKMNVNSTQTIEDVLKQQLNPIPGFFKSMVTIDEPKSWLEIKSLINKYKEIFLPKDYKNIENMKNEIKFESYSDDFSNSKFNYFN